MAGSDEVPEVARREVTTVVLLVDGDDEIGSWPLEGLPCPDLSVVDVLARLQLTAQRRGWSIRLRDPALELVELVELAGLGDVVRRD